MQLSPYLNIATRAVFSAGKVLVRCLNRLEPLGARKKYQISLINEAKLECEQEIAQTLLEAFPQHAILGIEIGKVGIPDSDYLWLAKSLDGTTNFVRALPFFAISIALQRHGETLVGLIYDPVRNELFTATKGGGAWIDKHRIRTRERAGLSEAIFGIGLAWEESLDGRYEHQAKKLISKLAETRKSGCTSLDLAYVAAGRLDGWWSCGLKAWDMAAGALLVAEAGGVVSDLTGESTYLENGNMLATTMSLREDVLALYETEAAREGSEPSAAATLVEETLEGTPGPAGEPLSDEHSDRDRPEERANRNQDSSHNEGQNESGSARRSQRPAEQPGPAGEPLSDEHSDRDQPEERANRNQNSSHNEGQNESGSARRSQRPAEQPGPAGEPLSDEHSDRDRPEERANRNQNSSHNEGQNESGSARRSQRPAEQPGPAGEPLSDEHSDRDRPEERANRNQGSSHNEGQNESGSARRSQRPAERSGWEARGRTPGSAGERFASEYSGRARPERRTNRDSDWSYRKRQNESGDTRRSQRPFAERSGWEARGRTPGPAGERFASEYSGRARPERRANPERRTNRDSDWSHRKRQNESGDTRRSQRPFAERSGWEARGRTPGPAGERFASEYSGRARPERGANRDSDWSHRKRQNESGNTRRSPQPFAERSGWEARGRTPGPAGERFASEYSGRARPERRANPERRTNRDSDWSHRKRQNESGNTRRSPQPFAERSGWEARGKTPGPAGERFASEYSGRARPERRANPERRTNRDSDWSHRKRQNESGNTRRSPQSFAERSGWEARGRTPGPTGERFASEYSGRARPERRANPERRTNRDSDWSHRKRQNESGNTRRSPQPFAERSGWEARGRTPGPTGERFASEYSGRARPERRANPERRTNRDSDWSHRKRQNESENTRKSPQPFAERSGWEARGGTPGPADERLVTKHSVHARPEKKTKETSDRLQTKKRNETDCGSEKRDQRKQQDSPKQEHHNHSAKSPESADKAPHRHISQNTKHHDNVDKSKLKEIPDDKSPVT